MDNFFLSVVNTGVMPELTEELVSQGFSEELVEEARRALETFVRENYKMLMSEVSIFGTFTLEVLPRHVSVITSILASKGATLQEIGGDFARRRNSKVTLTYYVAPGVIDDRSFERKSCG